MGETPVGMTALVTQLTTGITSSTIFSVVGEVMPFVITMIPIALGLYILFTFSLHIPSVNIMETLSI